MSVCPPEGHSTALNPDLVAASEAVLSREIREQLFSLALTLLINHEHWTYVEENSKFIKDEDLAALDEGRREYSVLMNSAGQKKTYEFQSSQQQGFFQTPYYGDIRNETNFPNNMEVVVTIPLKTLSNFSINLDLDMDTKKTKGGMETLSVNRYFTHKYYIPTNFKQTGKHYFQNQTTYINGNQDKISVKFWRMLSGSMIITRHIKLHL